jgi:hypothetical protein
MIRQHLTRRNLIKALLSGPLATDFTPRAGAWIETPRPVSPLAIERNQMKLYWVTTDDHDEDWFIVASSSQAACNAHEDMGCPEYIADKSPVVKNR